MPTHASPEQAVVAAVALLFVTISAGCSFTPPPPIQFCRELEDLPLTPMVVTPPVVVFETPGVATAIHGSGTATLDHGDFLKVEQSVEIPAYANRATVFLNGWRLEYTGNDDQNVAGLGTLIGKIRLEGTPRREGRRLTLNAASIIRDNDGDESYGWQYFYTVLAWNDTALNVIVNHDDADSLCKAGTGGSDNFYFASNSGAKTALSSFQSFVYTPQFPPTGVVAVLPRGFGVAWRSDHDLLQVAYNLDHSETFVEHNKTYVKAFSKVVLALSGGESRVDSRYVSWNTQSILKDNDLRRDYVFGEMVSALGGADVGTVQPPYSILPSEDIGSCVPSGGDVRPQDIVIENLPFEYAMPMLTGWELGYPCESHNVKEIGIGIDEWHYDKDPAAPTGTLRYKLSSILRDKDGLPSYYRSHKVSILGLRPVGQPTPGNAHP